MNVNGVSSSSSVQKTVNQPVYRQVSSGAPSTTPTDRVELSGMSHLLQQLKNNDIRVDKVAQIKSQIADGTYDDDAKLSGAVDKMLDDVT